MPNGISCAFFAARNFVYGKKEHNIFKEGIAFAQTTRTIDTVTKTGVAHSPIAKFFNKGACLARKIVYPLIIASGIYDTVKSDDKVRTGACNAAGISAMYVLEQTAGKGLKCLDNKIMSSHIVNNNKLIKPSWYIAKGLIFAAASLTGYTLGGKLGTSCVDKYREQKIINTFNDNYQSSFPLDGSDDIKETLFQDMKI